MEMRSGVMAAHLLSTLQQRDEWTGDDMELGGHETHVWRKLSLHESNKKFPSWKVYVITQTYIS